MNCAEREGRGRSDMKSTIYGSDRLYLNENYVFFHYTNQPPVTKILQFIITIMPSKMQNSVKIISS